MYSGPSSMQLLQEDLQRGYWDDFKELREGGGKMFAASDRLTPAAAAPAFPSCQVRMEDLESTTDRALALSVRCWSRRLGRCEPVTVCCPCAGSRGRSKGDSNGVCMLREWNM